MPRARDPKFSRQVKLASGGVVTLSGTADPLSLVNGDRAFVFSLIDAMAAYERANPVADKKAGDGGPAAGSAS